MSLGSPFFSCQTTWEYWLMVLPGSTAWAGTAAAAARRSHGAPHGRTDRGLTSAQPAVTGKRDAHPSTAAPARALSRMNGQKSTGRPGAHLRKVIGVDLTLARSAPQATALAFARQTLIQCSGTRSGTS